jgi:hypothetical protein
MVADPAPLETVPQRLSREDSFHDKIPPETLGGIKDASMILGVRDVSQAQGTD